MDDNLVASYRTCSNRVVDSNIPINVVMNEQQILDSVREIIDREAGALSALSQRLDTSVAKAVEQLLACRGRLIVAGMGKAGLIGRKAAATFCSTGTPASFLHPAEAIHGDLGLVHSQDVLLALSNSGETSEVLSLLPYMRRFAIPVITLTGKKRSTLAQQSDIVLDIAVASEADPKSPAPTCSTTAMLAMCDGLALTLMRCRGFGEEQFAIFHPGGYLGRKLLLRVGDAMRVVPALPLAAENQTLREVIVTMSRQGMGCAFILDSAEKLIGIITDGDLRRIFETHNNPLDEAIGRWMVRRPKTVSPADLAASALKIMEDHKITVLPVVDDQHRCVGGVHLHDLVRQGLA